MNEIFEPGTVYLDDVQLGKASPCTSVAAFGIGIDVMVSFDEVGENGGATEARSLSIE